MSTDFAALPAGEGAIKVESKAVTRNQDDRMSPIFERSLIIARTWQLA
jgi:hypothetical protein